MVVGETILHNSADKQTQLSSTASHSVLAEVKSDLICLDPWLGHNRPKSHPIVCQIGGNNPELLGQASSLVNKFNYDEINLNVGCPSPRVSANCFGARLMLHPETVQKCCIAMNRSVANSSTRVTVKCRLGADEMDSFQELCHFIEQVAEPYHGRHSGITHFYIHARKCLLDGLSTKENRSIPPLRPDWIISLALKYPDLKFSVNGGIRSVVGDAVDRYRIVKQSHKRSQMGTLGWPSLDTNSSARCDCKSSPYDWKSLYYSGIGGSVEQEKGESVEQENIEGRSVEQENIERGGSVKQENIEGGSVGGIITEGDNSEGGNSSGVEDVVAYQEEKELKCKTPSEKEEDSCLLGGVMIGRGAYLDPYQFSQIDQVYYGVKRSTPSRREIVKEYIDYLQDAKVCRPTKRGRSMDSVAILLKPLSYLFSGQRKGKMWRQLIEQNVRRIGAQREEMLRKGEDDYRVIEEVERTAMCDALNEMIEKMPDHVLDKRLLLYDQDTHASQ
eukprot:g2479.t1